jgi:ribosomal protein S18 acetylase RimI-like enzyme
MIIVRAARPEDLPGLTKVMAEAFNVKMRVLFGRDPARIQRMLTRIYAGPLARGYDGIVVAELEGRIVGGLVIEPMPWLDSDAHGLDTLIAAELGGWRRFWNHVGFSVFTHGPDAGDAYLSDVCVAADMRGRGIAQKMMIFAEEWARSHHRVALTLWVAAGNRPARRVYAKAGMKVVASEINLLSGFLYGIFRWVGMKKMLSDSSPS